MSITSEKNKSMLKGLLLEHPLLKLSEQEFNMVFEKEIRKLHQNRFNFRGNLIDMNKDLLKTFQKIGEDITKKEEQRKKQEKIKQQSVHQQFMNKRREERKREQDAKNFEQQLSNTKAEFDKVMTGKRPQEIDFSDKIQDKPIKSNQLDLTMSQREAELAEIMKQQSTNKNAKQWIQGDNNRKSNNDDINIKIDHSSNIPVNIDPIPGKPNLKNKITRNDTNRRVRFQIDESPNNNKKDNVGDLDFFQKLKLKNELNQQTNIFNNEIKDILKTICDNQLTIIQELKTMNTQFLKNLERNNKINKVENKVSEIVEDEYDSI
jgi:hypothetical protein